MTEGGEGAGRCPMTAGVSGEQCELPLRHNSKHSALNGALTWEPLYVADLRRALEDAQEDPWRMHLEDVLRDIGDGVNSEALDDAREALDGARLRDKGVA